MTPGEPADRPPEGPEDEPRPELRSPSGGRPPGRTPPWRLSREWFTGRPRRAAEEPATGQALLDVSTDGLLVIDARGRIRDSNAAAARAFGYPSLAGTPIAELFAPDAALEQRLLAIAAVDRMDSEGPFPVEARRADGVRFPVEVLARRISGAEDSPIALAVHDLRTRTELVLELTERAAQLARSNRELQEFAYAASHDLQEPLRMVASYTELVAQRYHGRLDADADEFLAFAHEGATRMQRLIDDLLLYSRVGTRIEPFQPLPLEECLAEALLNLAGSIAEAGAQVTHDPLPVVSVDRRQIVQLFQNLVGNAVKFHGTESPRVQVRVRDDGREWRFAVVDNGIGIEPAYHEQIFVLFQRLHLREEYPGTGIGLAVCKKIVERHRGRMGVESAGLAGAGATFWFTLPKERPPPPAPSAELPPRRRWAAETAESMIAERLQELI